MAKLPRRRATPSPKRSPCPVAATLDLIGDKWTLLVVRDLFAGKSRYKELIASPEGIATNILAARLHMLVEVGLGAATRSPDRGGAVDYQLTARGRSLLPVLIALGDWSLAHVPGTEAKGKIRESTTGTGMKRP